MRGIGIAAALLACLCFVRADDEKGHGDAKHVIVPSAEALKWGPAPPSLPSGAQIAVVLGDPAKEGAAYVMRVKMPDGYKVAPHWHPVDENVTVLQGALLMGRGENFDPDSATPVRAGGFAHMPKGMRHFAMAQGDTVIQVHGTGPFQINYVNPKDDPRKK